MLEAGHGLLAAAGLSAADIGAIVVGVGPGGFTGLRIGLATALGLGQALGVPVTGASSLEGLALAILDAAPDAELAAPVIDARRRELFCAAYRRTPGGGIEELLAPAARSPEAAATALAALGGTAWLGGDGVAAGGSALSGPALRVLPEGSAGHRPSAAALVRRVDAGAGLPARPVYARRPDAEVTRLRALATPEPAVP